MPDISMCDNRACPSFEKCYRAQAVASPRRQSFCSFKPDPNEDKCERFAEIRSGDLTAFRPSAPTIENNKNENGNVNEATRQRSIAVARRIHADPSDNAIEIDDNALVSAGEEGTWVAAWVWFGNDEEG